MQVLFFFSCEIWLPMHKDFLLSENRTKENRDKISSIKLYCIKAYKANLPFTFIYWMLASESLRRLWSSKHHRPLVLPTLPCHFQEGSGGEVRIPTPVNASVSWPATGRNTGLGHCSNEVPESFNVPPKSRPCHHTFNPCVPWLGDSGAAAICWLSAASLRLTHVPGSLGRASGALWGDGSDLWARLGNGDGEML